MVAPANTCEIHGEPTRISCVDCGKPICPKCMVRTEVGTKCEACSRPVEPRVTRVPPSRSARLMAAAGVGLVVAAVLVVTLSSHHGRMAKPAAPLRPAGSWATQPSLIDIRGTAAVVRLVDGRVLAAGGGVGAIPLAAAEIYDPGARTWGPTGSLHQARRGAPAVVLRDGRVLIAGGVAGAQLLASSEIYDPAGGRWIPTAPMTIPRLGGTLTLLPNGDVLAAGGTTTGGAAGTGGGQSISPTATAELYDVGAGTWMPTGSMGTPRFEAVATLLGDGRVLISGGLGGPGQSGGSGGVDFGSLRSAEIYDPAVGAFTGAGQMVSARADHVGARLPDGSVLVAGGLGGANGSVSLASAERFDPTSGQWSQVAALKQARTGAAAVVLGDGRVMVAGGEYVEQGSRRSLATAELFDPKSATWLSAGSMACPRSGLGLAALGNGTVLAVAGDGAFPGQAPVAQSCVDLYTPVS